MFRKKRRLRNQSQEVQVPEAIQHTEKERPSFEAKKRVQAHRQKPRFGLKTSEAAEEKEKALEFEEEDISKIPYDIGETRSTAPAFQAAISGKAEKPTGAPKISGVHGSRDHEDREVLEKLLLKKIISIAASLQDEKNPRSIAEDFELIDKGLGLIERLRQV